MNTRQQRLNGEALQYGIWSRGGVIDYDMHRYWRDRHEREGYTFRAGGDRGKSDNENASDYALAAQTLRAALHEQHVSRLDQIADFGCGIGYHLAQLREAGFARLIGVDITDTHFETISARVPGALLVRADLTRELPPLPALGVVFCLDVTQHIMTETRLRWLLRRNVVRCLVPGGLFLCTTLDDTMQRSYYERGWPITSYARELPRHSRLVLEPRPYRDKLLFGFRLPDDTYPPTRPTLSARHTAARVRFHVKPT